MTSLGREHIEASRGDDEVERESRSPFCGRSIRALVVTLVLVCWSNVSHAQEALLYADWIDSAEAARERGDRTAARDFYQRAFERRPALHMHALDMARTCVSLRDTSCVETYVNTALDQGVDGAAVEADSVLGGYWSSARAESSRALWSRYLSMRIPALKAELEAMFDADQGIRKAIDWDKADSPDSLVRRSVWAPIEAIDAQHTARVIEIIEESGVPSVHQVGLKGNKMVFFAFIHSMDVKTITDHILALSRSVRKGESPACWYAFVVDRAMVKTTKETMFGTTSYLDKSDGVNYFRAVSSAYVDRLREEVGLPRMNNGKRNAY